MSETKFTCSDFELGISHAKKNISGLLEQLFELRVSDMTPEEKSEKMQSILRDV